MCTFVYLVVNMFRASQHLTDHTDYQACKCPELLMNILLALNAVLLRLLYDIR